MYARYLPPPGWLPLTMLLGRDPEYSALNVRFTVEVANATRALQRVPEFLKPYVNMMPFDPSMNLFRYFRIAGPILTTPPQSLKVALKHLGPVIEERKRNIEEYGIDYPDKPVSLFIE